ncbi:putative WRKY transcription factor 12-like [Capsicum annuum]|uniref:Flotillin-like n=1 Tax=Capsicum annuum TaxID=4072 RepID=A0A2G3AM89_CAPAN|nr:putative WRKY transcription factor 12-like [Capsicum annuum]PHT95351.1 hypothetical protein T459_03233 [Capsicum annuum]
MVYRIARAFEFLVITRIGPCVDDHERLFKYAKLLSHHERDSHNVKGLAQAVIEGETRVLAASMTMEEIFKGTKDFKKEKTQMEAANQAKIDVVEAKMKGEIGAKEQEGLIRQNAAKIDAETKIISTQRDGEGKKEEVKVKTNVMINENQREAELAECMWTEVLFLLSIFSEGSRSRAYANQKAAEAKKLAVEAQTYAVQQAADAALYAKKKEAERLKGIVEAKGFYVHSLMSALGGNYHALRDYMIIDKGLFKNMAKCNAEAIKGLQPKISIWTNGGTSGQMANGTSSGPAGIKELASIYKALPPLFETVHEQTGMLPSSWMESLAVFAADLATSNRRST